MTIYQSNRNLADISFSFNTQVSSMDYDYKNDNHIYSSYFFYYNSTSKFIYKVNLNTKVKQLAINISMSSFDSIIARNKSQQLLVFGAAKVKVFDLNNGTLLRQASLASNYNFSPTMDQQQNVIYCINNNVQFITLDPTNFTILTNIPFPHTSNLTSLTYTVLIRSNSYYSAMIFTSSLYEKVLFTYNKTTNTISAFKYYLNMPISVYTIRQIFTNHKDYATTISYATQPNNLFIYSLASNFSRIKAYDIPTARILTYMMYSFSNFSQQNHVLFLVGISEYIFFDQISETFIIKNFTNPFLLANCVPKRTLLIQNRKQIMVECGNNLYFFDINCLQREFYDQIKISCYPCEIYCQSCTKTQCFKCDEGTYISEKHCFPCKLNCRTCEIQPNNCLQCAQYYIFNQKGECVYNMQDSIAVLALLYSTVQIPNQITFLQFIQIFMSQFWLYYFHNRSYRNLTQQMLIQIDTIQNSGWFPVSFQKFIPFSFSSLGFSSFMSYSDNRFLFYDGRSNFFWDGAFQLTFFTLPIVILSFILLKIMFQISYKHKISIYFRRYFFNLSLLFMVCEGNQMYLTYITFNHTFVLFYFKYFDKIGHVLWIFVNFLIVVFIFVIFFFAKTHYKKLAKYFTEECFNEIKGFQIYTILNFRSFILGSVHSLLFWNYQLQISLIIVIHSLAIGCLLYYQIKYRIYRQAFFLFMTIIKSGYLIIFNTLLLIDYIIDVNGMDQFTLQENDKFIMDIVYWLCGITFLQTISALLPSRTKLNDTKIIKEEQIKKKSIKRHVIKLKKIMYRKDVRVKKIKKNQLKLKAYKIIASQAKLNVLKKNNQYFKQSKDKQKNYLKKQQQQNIFRVRFDNQNFQDQLQQIQMDRKKNLKNQFNKGFFSIEKKKTYQIINIKNKFQQKRNDQQKYQYKSQKLNRITQKRSNKKLKK